MLAVDFDVQLEGELYGPSYVDEDMEYSARSTPEPGVVDVLQQMLKQQQELVQQSEAQRLESEALRLELVQQSETQRLESEEQHLELVQQSEAQRLEYQEKMEQQQLQLVGLTRQVERLTGQQQEQLFLLSQQSEKLVSQNEEFILQNEEFSQQNEEVMSQNQGQWELLVSIESAVVPACVDVVAEYAAEGGAPVEEKD